MFSDWQAIACCLALLRRLSLQKKTTQNNTKKTHLSLRCKKRRKQHGVRFLVFHRCLSFEYCVIFGVVSGSREAVTAQHTRTVIHMQLVVCQGVNPLFCCILWHFWAKWPLIFNVYVYIYTAFSWFLEQKNFQLSTFELFSLTSHKTFRLYSVVTV